MHRYMPAPWPEGWTSVTKAQLPGDTRASSPRRLVVVGVVRRTPAGTYAYTATRAGVTGVKAVAR